MASRVNLPKKRFHRIQTSHVVSLQESSHSLQKISAWRKTRTRAVRNSGTSAIVNINRNGNGKIKAVLRKPGKLLWFSRCGALFVAFPPTQNPSGAVFQPQVSKFCSTSKFQKLSGWSLHFGLCHAVLLDFQWEFPPGFIFGVQPVLGTGMALPGIPPGLWSDTEQSAARN